MVANRDGKDKSDKETQSPMQKIFKELMEREIRDPEKESLLRERIEERRRKCNQARFKSVPRSYDSSGSERKSIEKQRNMEMTRRRNEYVGQILTTKTGGPLSEASDKDAKASNSDGMNYKRDSWCFWKEAQKKSEETCSCYSCVLSKYIFSHNTSIACLILLFIFTLIFAFFILMRTTSLTTIGKQLACDKTTLENIDISTPDSDHFRRRLEAISKDKEGQKEFIHNGVNSYASNRKFWDDSEAGDVAAFNSYDNSPYDLEVSTQIDESADDFNKLLRDSKVNMESGDDSMKNFYKKFFQTEALVRTLKKKSKETPNDSFGNTNRGKRSLKPVNRDKSKKLERLNKKYVIPNPKTMQNLIMKDNHNNKLMNISQLKTNKKEKNILDDKPASLVLVKKKVIMQFTNNDQIRKSNVIPKCSHSPKDYKYHEIERTHPFYKNTQKLDELLDKMLKLKLPVAGDPLAIDLLLNNDNSQCKHLNTSITTQSSEDMKQKVNKFDKMDNLNGIEKSLKSKLKSHSPEIDMKAVKENKFKNLKTNKNEALTVQDILSKEELPMLRTIYDDYYSNGKMPINYFGLRKLLQNNDKESNYQFDSYMQDEKNDYDNDIVNIGKRSVLYTGASEETGLDDINEKLTNVLIKKGNFQPELSHNPNWKGPMPLYPDEISTIIRQAAIENVYNAIGTKRPRAEEFLINIKDNPSEIESKANYMADIDYIENYLNSRIDRYVKMAQAYSDYGVLDENEDSTQKQQGMAESKNSDEQPEVNISFMDTKQKYKKDERYKKGLHEDANTNGSNIEKLSTEIRLPLTKSVENENVSGNSKFLLDLNDNKESKFPVNLKEKSDKDSKEREKSPNFIFNGNKRSLLMYDYISQDVAKDNVRGDNSKLQPKDNTAMKIKNSGNLQLENNNDNMNYSQLNSPIGFKSRSLLSVESDKNIEINDNMTLSSLLHKNHSTIYNTTIIKDLKSNSINSTKANAENKTVVKRHIRNENLVFWNDLYDDEYGVNLDPFSDDLMKRIKLSSKPDKAKNWLKTKFEKLKKIVQAKKNHTKSYMKPKKPNRYANNYRYRRYSYFGNNNNRDEQKSQAPPTIDQFTNFQKLSMKMKDIFKQAAIAINSEKTADLSEPNSDEALSNSLMQQLVKMLNDLIDYQVQQKTCRKLPQDLQNFLAWLTESKNGHVTPTTYTIEEPEDFSAIKYNIHNNDIVNEDSTNFKMNSDYFKSWNALQELMQEYTMLTDNEKSKMPKMKEYLENQMDYIQRNILLEDKPMNNELGYLSYRFKRDAPKNKAGKVRIGERMKRRLGRFIKTYNKKHTRSTATSFDLIQVNTEIAEKRI